MIFHIVILITNIFLFTAVAILTINREKIAKSIDSNTAFMNYNFVRTYKKKLVAILSSTQWIKAWLFFVFTLSTPILFFTKFILDLLFA